MTSSSCCICQDSSEVTFELTKATKYSKEPLHKLIESISASFMGNSLSVVCPRCLDKLNHFDELFYKAMEVKFQLCQMIEAAAHDFVRVKVEVTPFEEDMKLEDFQIAQNLSAFNHEFVNTHFEPSIMLSVPSKKRRRPGRPSSLEPGEPAQCTICGKFFRTRGLCTKHQKRHSDEKHECATCGKVFKLAAYLQAHNKIHLGMPGCICDICGFTASRKQNISNHIKTLHMNVRDYLCSQCPKAYANATALKKHMMFHSDFRPLACSICEARFHTNYNLQRHMRSHGPRDQFSCEICKRNFAENYQLTTHMRNVHSIGKKKETQTIHTCYICTKQFDRPGKLRKHLVDTHELILETLKEEST